jgi:MoaA/NifB/PqqE/SkfB family radical SAM enzyme
VRHITAVALDITTACNLSCPECCCRAHERKTEQEDGLL